MAAHPLPRLLRYARSSRRAIAAATAFSVLNKLFDLAPPFLIGAAVDVVVNRESSLIARFGFPDPGDQIWLLAVLTIVIWAFESIFEYAANVWWRNLAQTLQRDLRADVYGNVQRLELSYFEDRSTGGLLAVLSDDVNQLERFLDGGAHDLIQLGVTAVAIGAAFFVLSPEVAWLAMLPVPAVIWGSLHFQRRIAPRYVDVRERVEALNAVLGNNVGGMATIQSFGTEKHEAERVDRESEAYRQANRRAIRLSSAFSPLIRMVIVVGFGVTLVYGGFLTLDGRLAVGSYSIMVFLTQRLLWPFTRLGAILDLYQRAMASTRRILDLHDVEPAVRDGDRPLPLESVRGAVAFEDVDFAYTADVPVLRGLTFAAEPGRMTAIVGATGAGKSTIVKLLLRLYADHDERFSGRVTLDGADVRTLRLDDLRRAVALVSQDVFLFPGTIAENIAYGRLAPGDEPASREEVEAAARAAEAHGFVARLPRGYDTVVGERGQRLSGGQRQRIALARAILKDAPLLVLDEATSSVDNETEAAIQRSLERIGARRTTIVIAHRLSTIRHADHIVVIDAGRVVEEGTHEALLDRGGLYAGLWAVQTGEAGAAGVTGTRPTS